MCPVRTGVSVRRRRRSAGAVLFFESQNCADGTTPVVAGPEPPYTEARLLTAMNSPAAMKHQPQSLSIVLGGTVVLRPGGRRFAQAEGCNRRETPITAAAQPAPAAANCVTRMKNGSFIDVATTK